MDLKLEGKTCLVTGASAGIGDAIARILAREGVRLAITARREDRLEQLAADIASETGARPFIVTADLLDGSGPETVRAAVEAEMGGLDILINNAGLSSPHDPRMSDGTWDHHFNLKFTTVRRLTNAFLPALRRNGWGRIITVTGIVEPAGTSPALTACAAVHAWAKGLSRDLAKDGITVNCVPPGRIDSEQILKKYPVGSEIRDDLTANHIPMRRFGAPEELANLVTFLASPRADYITGTVIPVDGGMSRFSM